MFLSHYFATYALYISNPNVWIACFIYAVVMTIAIYVSVKLGSFDVFFKALIPSVLSLSGFGLYTFISLW